MALYDYRCEDCTEMFEVDLPMGKKRPPQKCPVCNGYRTKKVILEAAALRVEWMPDGAGDTSLPRFHKKVRSKKHRREELEGYLA